MELLQKLTAVTAVSGNENLIFDVIETEIKDYVDELYTDNLGNIIAHKKGDGKKLAYISHVDEVGIIANYVDEKGFVRFSCVGDINLNALVYNRVKFENGVVGLICDDRGENSNQKLTAKNAYIDIGADSKSEAMSMISPGDTAALMADFYNVNGKITSKSLDNRVGVYALIEAVKKIDYNSFDLYFVFSAQNELGMRGAKAAVYDIDPHIAISIDATPAGDIAEGSDSCVSLGGGTVIKIMDGSIITHKGLRNSIVRIAQDNNVKIQYEINPSQTSDAGAVQNVGAGTATAAISIPVRYIHTPCELVKVDDIDSCIRLVCEISKKDFILI